MVGMMGGKKRLLRSNCRRSTSGVPGRSQDPVASLFECHSDFALESAKTTYSSATAVFPDLLGFKREEQTVG